MSNKPGKHRLRETTDQGKHFAHGEQRETQVKRKPGANLPHDEVVQKAAKQHRKKHGG